MRQLFVQKHLPILALTLGLIGCAGPAKHPATLAAKPEASRIDVQTAAFENGQVKTFEPIRVQTGRYSVVTAKPSVEQINPLLMSIDVRLPRDILTVKDAADYLLQRSEYRLAGTNEHAPQAQALLHQTIPDVQRHLGPLTLQDALLTLGGQAFRLRVDFVNHLVAYELSPTYQTGGL